MMESGSKAVLGQAALLGFALSGFGGALWIGLPAAAITGPLIALALANSIRPLPELHPALRDAALLLSGASMGTSVTPETLGLLARYPVSIASLVVCVVLTMAVGSLWLIRARGWSLQDALLGTAPGALSTVLSIASDLRANFAAIVVTQNVRIFALVAFLPSVVALTDPIAGRSGMAAVPDVMDAGSMAMILALGYVGGLVFARLEIAAPLLIATALVSATLHGSAEVSGRLPDAIATTGFVVIGAYIAGRMRDVTRKELTRHLGASLVLLAISVVICGAFALLSSWLVGVSLGSALLAFAPGALEAMIVLSLALDLDPLYVATHHLVRFFGIAIALPLAMIFLKKRRKV